MNAEEEIEKFKQGFNEQAVMLARRRAVVIGLALIIALISMVYAFIQNAKEVKARTATIRAQELVEEYRVRAERADVEVNGIRKIVEAQKEELERSLFESREALKECQKQGSKGRASK